MRWTEQEYAGWQARQPPRAKHGHGGEVPVPVQAAAAGKTARTPRAQLSTTEAHAMLIGARAPDILTRYRSKAELRFADKLMAWQHAGVIDAWAYEPCKGLYLAAHTSYTPDFLTRHPGQDRRLTLWEVKGAFIREKDWIKLKLAAERYGAFFDFILAQWHAETWRFQVLPTTQGGTYGADSLPPTAPGAV